jgi:hypothetical protein
MVPNGTFLEVFEAKNGGEGGIRTPGTLARTQHFQKWGWVYKISAFEVEFNCLNWECFTQKGDKRGKVLAYF